MNSKKASFKATSLLLALLLCFSLILTPALATTSNVFGSVLPTSDIGENFTPTDAMADSDIQELTDTSTVLDESDIIYMVLTDRFLTATVPITEH